MNNLETRLRKIEAASGEARFCKCPGRVRVLWPDDERHTDKAGPAAPICEHCGGHRQTVRVVYDAGPEVN